jgi:16S rRNA (cytidine1402-2'-O)-methyltransferase
VATPIGNLEDMTIRAVRVLKEVGLIAAEDTRHTRKLLTHYGISTSVTSYHEHNEIAKSAELVEKIKQGLDLALVTDAGTPGVSDPGYRLVNEAARCGVEVVAVPGASAVIAVLSIAGMPTDEFTFKGFLPSTSAKRRNFLAGIRAAAGTFILYESPRRLLASLEDMRSVLGDVELVIGREMTKLHEETIRGRVTAVIDLIKGRKLKGEVAIVVTVEKPVSSVADIDGVLRGLIDAGIPMKEAVKVAAKELGLPKNEVYKKALDIKASYK